jgi:hypothetical protein
MARRTNEFQTIRSEGGLLPPDLLRRVLDPKEQLDGTRPEDYGLPQGERLNEVITQSWNRLRKHWAEFRAAAAKLPEGEAGTGLTNDKWSLPLLRELGFGLLPTSAGPAVGGRTYAISRFFGPVPVHLVGCGLSLDHRAAGVRGAAAANPHGLVQEFLNRSSTAHVWAIISNGLRFRILRDNQALSRQSFLEFDLEAMFTGEVYSDFVLLWLIAHATRFAPREAERADSCWLEQWTKLANEQGTRALRELRGGVERALQTLGEGFTSHPKNTALRDALRSGRVPLADFHGQLLRVVYRLIFLFVAEDRTLDGQSLLHPRDGSEGARLARERYTAYYSTARLRELASNIKGSRHGDLWRQFQLLLGPLSGDPMYAAVRDHLALPALGSFLWDPTSTANLKDTELTNHDFLEALRQLAFTRQGKVLRPVDYKNLGAEELGGVYESLLALTPQISADGARFTFAEFAGNERKTSGSYYTHDSLVQCLLDSALDPVVAEAIKGKTGAEAERAILSLKVCDPAVGSGHFLVGAAHRLARHLARVRALAHGDSEPSPLLYQHALRDVIGHCLYGVDMNPMAAELCRVSLWLEALEPGKPLSFLDHHIRVGNSLLGATPELIAAGLPDEAFDPVEGDDGEACSNLKRLNRLQREALRVLFVAEDNAIRERLRQSAAALDEMDDSEPETVKRKEAAFRSVESNDDLLKARTLANLWCAAFIIRKRFAQNPVVAAASMSPTVELAPSLTQLQTGLFGGTEEVPKVKTPKKRTRTQPNSAIPIGITTQHLRDFVEGDALPEGLLEEVQRLAASYQFFHWHLAFAEVFARGGFDAILGNPPWEVLEDEEKKFFAQARPDIAEAETAERKDLIERLNDQDPTLHRQWLVFRDGRSRFKHFHRASGHFPLSSYKKLNLYASMLENGMQYFGPCGYLGMVLQSGLGTGESRKFLFQDLFNSKRLRSFLDFENTEGLFPEVHPQQKFSLVTISRQPSEQPARLSFYNTRIENLQDEERSFFMTAEDMKRVSPNTGACPTFRNRRDAQVILRIYQLAPVFHDESQTACWRLEFMQMFNSSSDNRLFKKAAEVPTYDNVADLYRRLRSEHWLPVYEGKFIDNFNHRLATFQGRSAAEVSAGSEREHSLAECQNPLGFVVPRWWAPLELVSSRLANTDTPRQWLFGFCDIANPQNARTASAAFLPYSGVSDTIWLLMGQEPPDVSAALCGMINSFVLDFVARRRIGSRHLKQFVFKQLPFLEKGVLLGSCPWQITLAVKDCLLPQVLELTYTAWDLEPFAQDCNWPGPPFRWDEERRFLLRCELDAAFFHLYLGQESRVASAARSPHEGLPNGPRRGVVHHGHVPHRQAKGRRNIPRRLPHQACHSGNV